MEWYNHQKSSLSVNIRSCIFSKELEQAGTEYRLFGTVRKCEIILYRSDFNE